MKSYLEARRLEHAIVRCRECITGRHLLESTIGAVQSTLQQDQAIGEHAGYHGRCENLGVLTAHLQRLLRGDRKFVLVLDAVDKQRDAQPTLLPALARLGEFVCAHDDPLRVTKELT